MDTEEYELKQAVSNEVFPFPATGLQYHGNPNQLCFLARRVDGEESDQLAQFLQREYSVVNILGRERAHGYMWWSTGGETTNRVNTLDLS